jgi:hypothetical protein
MVNITVLCNWTSPDDLYEGWKKQSKDGAGSWNNIQLTSKDEDIVDVVIVINGLPSGPAKVVQQFPNALYFLMEPYAPSGWERPYDHFPPQNIYTHDRCTNIGEWHLSYTYSQLKTLSFNGKYDRISTIQSQRNVDIGHKLRLAFIDSLNDAIDTLYCYGSYQTPKIKHYMGRLPANAKEDGLRFYKYHFAAENHAIPNYFTEKIIDGILTECLVFYWGCPNLEEYLPADSFVRLSLVNFEDDIETIRRAIAENWWEKRLPVIRKAKQIILDQLQFFPLLERIIAERAI